MFAKLVFYLFLLNSILFNLVCFGAAINTNDTGDVSIVPNLRTLQVAHNSTKNIESTKDTIRINEGGDLLETSKQDDIKPIFSEGNPSKVDPVEYVFNKKGYEQKSSVQARKGVEMILNGSTDLSINGKEKMVPPQVLVTTKLTVPQLANESHVNITSIVPIDKNVSSSRASVKFHKPLVTSFNNDDLDLLPPLASGSPTKIEVKNETIKAVSTSGLKNIITEQQDAHIKENIAEPEVKLTDSTTVENISTFKKYIGPLSRAHPNYIIPIIITIFAVPIFGILGLTAIRRGREAWKNRHYRRMDFLIDGMYND